MRVVIALGGNALLRRGERPELGIQRRNVQRATAAIAEVARIHQVTVTHGNGPQVGLLALQTEADKTVGPYPLDVLDAESEGMLGYLIDQELMNRLPDHRVVTLLTQVEVSAADPAFDHPSKPIGPLYKRDEAERLAVQRGWLIAPDGDAYRRVVPSPEPLRIIEIEAIRMLVDAGAVVICVGGGGIPVICTASGALRGVEAVIDKDHAAALLAMDLGAEALLLLTDVDHVYANWSTPDATPIRNATPAMLRQQSFAAGSMGPKVAAACRFVERSGGRAGIGELEDAGAILTGAKGTLITPA